MSTQKTVKVRILVAVDSKGEWSAYGYTNNDEATNHECLWLEGMDGREAYYWVTAEVPIPETKEIEGKVES